MRIQALCSDCHRVRSVRVSQSALAKWVSRGKQGALTGICNDCTEKDRVRGNTPRMEQLGYFWACQSPGCYGRLQCGSFCSKCNQPASDVRA